MAVQLASVCLTPAAVNSCWLLPTHTQEPPIPDCTGKGAYLVAHKVSGRVHLEQLRAALLVHSNQHGDHAQRPHAGVLQAGRRAGRRESWQAMSTQALRWPGPAQGTSQPGRHLVHRGATCCHSTAPSAHGPACRPAPGPPARAPGSAQASRSQTCGKKRGGSKPAWIRALLARRAPSALPFHVPPPLLPQPLLRPAAAHLNRNSAASARAFCTSDRESPAGREESTVAEGGRGRPGVGCTCTLLGSARPLCPASPCPCIAPRMPDREQKARAACP